MNDQPAPAPAAIEPPPPANEPPPVAPPPAAGPVFTVKRPLLGSLQLLADGVPLKRKGMFGLTYLLPMADGTTKEIQVRGVYSGAKVVVDGVEQQVEPSRPVWLSVLAALPLAIIVLGGALGALIGAIGFIVNLRIASSSQKLAVQLVAMVLVAVVTVGVWLGIVGALVGAAAPAVGDCYDGIHPNSALVQSQVKEVPCSGPHDAELYGPFPYPNATTYPTDAQFQAFAEQECVPAYLSYVGIAISDSAYGAIPVLPDEQQWNGGSHSVRCMIVSLDGSKITGSLKGTKK
jgi:hypothetical protein